VPPGPIELEIAAQDARARSRSRNTQARRAEHGPRIDGEHAEVFRGARCRSGRSLPIQALPVIEREFRRTDRLLFAVGAQSAGGTPVLSARMLNREGGEMSVLTVTPAGSAAESDRRSAGALPPGDFLIEVIAKEAREQPRR
jgi:hypothetical protein